MTSLPATVLGAFFALSETGLAFFKRAKKGETRAVDRDSLVWLWIVIVICVNLAYALGRAAPQWGMGAPEALPWGGAAVFGAGIALRWYAIIYLGRFFTVNVAIAADHRLIDSGPYAWVRHPSYSGALAAFIGLGLSIGNWAALLVMVVPTFLIFSWRIRVEEAALVRALGAPYIDYMRDTKRLIPHLY